MQSYQAAMPRPRHVPMQQPTTAVSVPWDPNVRRKRAAGCWWGGTLGKDSSTSAGCAKAAGCWACPARRRQCGVRVSRKLHSCLYGGAGLHVDGRGLQLGRPKLERHLQGGRGSSRNVWVEVGGRAANTVRRAVQGFFQSSHARPASTQRAPPRLPRVARLERPGPGGVRGRQLQRHGRQVPHAGSVVHVSSLLAVQ